MTTIADGLKDVFLAGVGAMALGVRTVRLSGDCSTLRR